MNTDEAKTFATEVKSLFKELTSEQIGLAVKTAKSLRESDARSVLLNHRLRHEFFCWPEFSTGVEAAFSKRSDRRHQFATERMVDGLRRMARGSWGISDYESMSDDQVIMVHFSSLIESLGNPPKAMRLYVLQKCRQALQEIGKGVNESYQAACEISGIAPDKVHDETRAVMKEEKMSCMQALLM